MARYKSMNEFSEYYRVLFSLPGIEVLVILTVLFNIILYLLLPGKALYYTIYYVLVFLTVFIYARYSDSVFRKVKRVIGLALIVEFVSVITGLMDFATGLIYSMVFLILAIQGIDGTRIYKYGVASLPVFITILLTGKPIYLIALPIPILLDYIIYIIMGIYRVDGYRMPDLGTMYLKNFLMKSRDIERFFNDLSIEAYVSPRYIRGGRRILLVYSDIHYGPFSNIGSSMFPSLLLRELLKHGITNVVVFHGMGTHDRNIPTYKDMLLFLRRVVDDVLDEDGWITLRFHGWKRLSDDEWDLLIIVFDKITLILISRRNGIDDLPYELQEYIGKVFSENGLCDVVLIDCHNHELSDKPDLDKLRKLLSKSVEVVSGLLRENPIPYIVTSANIGVKAPGIVNDYISIHKLSTPENSLLLLYIPGNNMEPGLRDKIRRFISRKTSIPVDNIEVLTNDEHTETGTSAYKVYTPVLDSRELFDALSKLIDELNHSNPEHVLYYKRTHHPTRIIGDKINKLKELVGKSFILSSILTITYITITPFLIYIILSLL